MKQNPNRRVRFILLNLARVFLLAILFFAYVNNRNLLLLATLLLFIFSFLPTIIEKIFKIESHAFFDVTLLLIIFGVFSYWEIQGVYSNSIFLAVLMNFISAIAIAFLGFTLVYSFFKHAKIETNPNIIAFFSFCFSFSLGVIFELMEVFIDNIFGFNIEKSGIFGITGDLTTYLLGSFLISSIGSYFIKKGKSIFVSEFLEIFVEKNPHIFGIEKIEDHSERIKQLVKKGESNNLEFKSTLRKNLFTKKFDRNIEHASLKTISAYLNSEGGTLLVGVADNGDMIGIEEDQFESKDHINRHLNNLISNHIGAEFMPFINTDIHEIDGKKVIEIKCKSSNKEVFIKNDNNEDFYIRRGSLSMPLSGSSLLNYIETKFRRSN